MARTVTVALRLFSAVFLGSGLLLVAMLFVGAGTSASPMATLAGTSVNAEVYAFGRNTVRSLFSVYAMRMAAVFTPAVSTVGIRTSAVPRWVSYLGYLVGLTRLVAARLPMDPAGIPRLGSAVQPGDPLRPPTQLRQPSRTGGVEHPPALVNILEP